MREIKILECKTLNQLNDCVRLQREVFALPEVEISPVRHFIVNLHVGGFTIGAFDGEKLVGFSLSVPAYIRGEKAFYSHMTAVSKDYQSDGIGAKLKWKQREKALSLGVKFIKWTFQPVMARNAFFNLEKLGAVVVAYKANFYGTDYATSPEQSAKVGIDSDRLFAEWHLDSKKVQALASKQKFIEKRKVITEIETVNNWNEILSDDPSRAKKIQTRIKKEFQNAFAENLHCEGFKRDTDRPAYLFY